MRSAVLKEQEVVVIGLGYVGLTLSAFMADRGMKVHGIEIRELVLGKLREKSAFFFEPGLDELLGRTISEGSFTFETELLRSNSERIFIITVGTPIDANRKVMSESIIRVAEQVSQVINDGDMVILRSTVMLNTTKNVIQPILEKSGKNFLLAFCPERTLEGAALSELGTLPQIVGGVSDESTRVAVEFFSKITSTVVKVSNSETAELIKLVDNMQRDVKFAIANEIADICNTEQIKATEVISAGKFGYPRTNLPFPGPVGGPCLEKDSYILAESVLSKNISPLIALSARTVNENMIVSIGNYVHGWFEAREPKGHPLKISILGIAFKGIPETNDLRGTPSLKLLSSLRKILPPGTEFLLWDPVVSNIEARNEGHEIEENLETVLLGSNCVILANNHPSISELSLTLISKLCALNVLVYDMWGRHDNATYLPQHMSYVSWGSHLVSEMR
jgi:UDP-N-acetyl-D-mannosaminuronic acid dehydrogenase